MFTLTNLFFHKKVVRTVKEMQLHSILFIESA